MLEWLANNYKKFGCALEFVTDRSEEGNQFCKGFGGIGGVLRYSVRCGQLWTSMLGPPSHPAAASKAHVPLPAGRPRLLAG